MTGREFVDAAGTAHAPAGPEARIVSLVPSLTEALFALGLGERVVRRSLQQARGEVALEVGRTVVIGQHLERVESLGRGGTDLGAGASETLGIETRPAAEIRHRFDGVGRPIPFVNPGQRVLAVHEGSARHPAPDALVRSGLQELVLLYPGHLAKADGSERSFASLVESGPLSGRFLYPQIVQRSFFGAERDGGRRSHHGVDIFAPRGTPVVAAVAGRVSRVQETNLGDLPVWIEAKDGAPVRVLSNAPRCSAGPATCARCGR